jgi:Flp pilus assembly protein TadD
MRSVFSKVIFAGLMACVVPALSGAQDIGLITREMRAYFDEGVKLQQSGNYAAATTAYQKVLLVTPQSPMRKYILNNFGVMFLAQGDVAAAEQSFREALALDPEYTTARENLGIIIEKRMSRCEALEYWAQLYKFDQRKPKEAALEILSPDQKK